MNRIMQLRKIYWIGLFLVIIPLILTCREKKETVVVDIDLEQIKKRGKLIAMTGYSATSYFIYKGQPMGYEYELLTRLADHLDLELDIMIENNFEELFKKLNLGVGDIIAHDLTITQQRKRKVNFTEPLLTTQQVLVQRKPENWRQMKLHEINDHLITNPIQLIGKKVYVKEASSYAERLRNLMEEIGGKIDVVEVKGDTTTEQLIQAVAKGKIDYTVADQHIAMINQAHFRNLKIKTNISLPQRVAWAVRKSSPILLQEVNSWIKKMKKKTEFYVIRNKYFKNRREFIRRAKSEFLSLSGGKISKYDELIKEHAKIINWDWRLLASLIYQESQFEPHVKSWSGAIGLMQLLPETAREFGANNPRNVQQNIKAGVKYIDWLDNYWKKEIENETERLKFILASYNVGIGHVQDARRLAEKNDRDPNTWDDNVAYFILRLSEKKYYTDEVVNYGYCRGLEPFNYVKEILRRYRQYSKFIV